MPSGGFRFWQGPTVPSGTVPDSSLCGSTGSCYTWSMPGASGGWRLRVRLDTPLRSNEFERDVIDPSGHVTSATNSGNFDSEVYILHPAGGVWTIRVMPQDISYSSFRMRAKLETQPPPMPTLHIPLLPELRADPPLEFTFTAPANPANGHPLSCGADEMAPTAVQGGNAHPRCLRFTSGPMNVGRGVYEPPVPCASTWSSASPRAIKLRSRSRTEPERDELNLIQEGRAAIG